MAEQLLIGPTRAPVKLRSPWAAALLPFVTLGIYHLVWWYRINRELRDVGHGRGVDLGEHPTNSLLALFPGALIIIPPFVSYWNGTKRVMRAAEIARSEPVNGWIALILFIVIQPAYWAYLQSSLNHAWRASVQAPADDARLRAAPAPDRDGAALAAGDNAPPTAASDVAAAGPDPTATRARDPLLDAPTPAAEPGGEPTARPD
jgi:Domain of unknown function (DUF4234)